MRRILYSIAGILLLLGCAAASRGQVQSTTGTIQGDVTDAKGGGVPGAAVADPVVAERPVHGVDEGLAALVDGQPGALPVHRVPERQPRSGIGEAE